MFEDAYMHLNEGGLFTIVIRKQQGAESAVKKLNEIFNNCEAIDRDKGYWILQSSKLTGWWTYVTIVNCKKVEYVGRGFMPFFGV